MGTGETAVALVLLTPRSGRKITGKISLTAQTLPEYAPDPADVSVVTEILQSAGFRVGPAIGISMSIEGSPQLFNEFFGTQIMRADDGGWVAVGGNGFVGLELPLARLPQELRGRVAAVTFEPPAELMRNGD